MRQKERGECWLHNFGVWRNVLGQPRQYVAQYGYSAREMSLRWRKSGELICGAKSEPMDGDCYIDDRLHYELSAIQKTVVPDKNEGDNGLWYWLHNNPHKNARWVAIQTRR